jgi:predicted lipoprotein with Yx(FWY)xxD motif
MNRIGPVVAGAVALVAIASLSACGDMADGAQGPQHGEPGHKMLQVGTVNGVGMVVTDDDGKTLYRFDKDVSSPPTSNCDGDCTKSWLPMLAGVATPMLKGIQDTQVGTATRKDGTKQITLNGWPLYEYAGDKAAGDMNGQGANGTWFAVAPDGSKITAGGKAGGAGS